MMQLNEEQRKGLLDEIDYNRKNCFLSSKTELLMEIAEDCLKAKEVGIFANRAGVWVELYQGDTFEHPDAVKLYATQTITALRLPDEVPIDLRIALHSEIGTDGYNNQRIWELVIDEVKRLNATKAAE